MSEDKLLRRELKVESVDLEQRTVTGVSVPWDTEARVFDWDRGEYVERFERGAVEWHDGIKLLNEHSELTGVVTKGRELDQGYEVTARIRATRVGNDVYELLQPDPETGQRALDSFSIGFEPVEHRVENEGTDNEVLVRTKVKLREVSTTWRPAYDTAKISAVREARDRDRKDGATMGDQNNDPAYATPSDVAAVRTELGEVERRMLATLDRASTGDSGEAITTGFRSMAEVVSKLAKRELTAEAIAQLNRAFTGATTGDANVKDAWVDRAIRLVAENRNIWEFFTSEPLPPSGNNVDFPVLGSTTGTVGVQANEGDDLPYMEVVILEGTRPVKTYGGYSSLSRQAIERSNYPYLSKVLQYQALQYAKATNSAARALLTGMPTSGAGASQVAALTAFNAADVVELVIDAVGNIAANSMGLGAEAIITGLYGFKGLATIVDGDERPVFAVNADGQNSIGNADITKLRLNIGGMPVLLDPRYTGEDAFVVSRDAITTMESPGAPYRLEDENIINLTKDFSLYGYASLGVSDPKGVVRVDLPASA